MRNILEDIQEKLQNITYKNEEHVRLSLVSRILQNLGWDIWNPNEVNTEFSPKEEKGKIDIALFPNQYLLSPLYLEIKATDKLRSNNELLKAEKQLRDYNVDLTALFTILTDGNQWRFYYSQEGGTFSQKCFKVIEILKDDLVDVEFAFNSFLKKEKILNGNAKNDAYKYLKMNRKQQIMEASLANAKREQDNDPLLNLVDALYNEVKLKDETITIDEVKDFLNADKEKKRLKPNRTETIKPEIEESIIPPKSHLTSNDLKIFSLENPYDLGFTKVIKGTIDSEPGNNWQNLLRLTIKKILDKGVSHSEIKDLSSLNIEYGNPNENGYHQITGTNYSLQNVDANKSGRAILIMARKYNLTIEIEFAWRDKPQAAFPSKRCKIIN